MVAGVADWVGLQLGESPYRILGKVGVGGMAELYQAEDVRTGKQLLLQVPTSELLRSLPSLPQHMARDFEGLSTLQHPHLLAVLGQGEYSGRPFLVFTSCAPGDDLLKRMTAGKGTQLAPKPAEFLGSWLAGTASALDYIHSHGHLHADIRPTNIFFNEKGQPTLGPPALARPRWDDHRGYVRNAGLAFSLPRYLAPEFLAGQAVDGRADQFSLALIVWEWLTGRSLITGDTPAEVTRNQQVLSSLPTSMPAVWLTMLRKALEPRPEQRFPSCQDFSSALLARIDATGGPIMEMTDSVNFNIFLNDSLSLMNQGPSTQHPAANSAAPPPVPPASTPAYVPYRGTSLDQRQPTMVDVPYVTPVDQAPVPGSDYPPDEEFPPPKKAWGLRLLFLALVIVLAGLAGSLFLPGTAVHNQMLAWLKREPSTKTPAPGLEGKTPSLEPKKLDPKVLSKMKALEESLRLDLKKAEEEKGTLAKKLEGEAEKRAKAEKELLKEKELLAFVQGEVIKLGKEAKELETKLKKVIDLASKGITPEIEEMRRRIRAAEELEKRFTSWVLITNTNTGTVEFETHGISWEGKIGPWDKHVLKPGEQIFLKYPGNSIIELRYHFFPGDPIYETVVLHPEVRSAGAPAGTLETRYRFITRMGRLMVEPVRTGPKKG